MSLGANDWSNNTFYIRYFKDLNNFIDIGRQAAKETKNKLTDLDINISRGYTYPDQNQLNNYLKKFESIFDNPDLGGNIKKEKLKITDDERGIFDFSLASQGLYRSLEYYSKDLEIESPDEFPNKEAGIVPDNFVQSKNLLGRNIFIYKSKNGKDYELTQQQEGTKKMLSINPDAKIKTTKNGLIYVTPTTYKGFSLKFKTKNKKNYLLFDKKGGKAKLVDIYFPIHASVNLRSILPSLILAKFLETINIQTRINALRVYQETGTQWGLFGYPIKDYNEPLNLDYIAFNSAQKNFTYNGNDSSWWDAIQNMVRAIMSKDYIGNNYTKSGYGIAQGTSGVGSSPGDRKDWVELFSRYRNWYLQQIDKGEVEPLRIDKKLIFFGGVSYDVYDINNDDERVLSEFYLMLDKVDIQFNEKDSLQRIYKRMVEDKLSKYMEMYENSVNVYNAFFGREKLFDNFMSFYFKKEYEKTQKSESFDNYLRSKGINKLWRSGILLKEAVKNSDDFYISMKGYLIKNFKQYIIDDVLLETYTYPIGGEYEESQSSAEKLDQEFEKNVERLETFLSKL